MFDRFTERARKIMGYARQEAESFNHDYISPEDILLGLVKEGSSVATDVLKNLDVNLDKVRAEVERSVTKGPEGSAPDQLPFNDEAKRALDGSLEAARELEHKYVGTEHLLLGLLRVRDCVAAKVLASLGVKAEDVRREVIELLGDPTDSIVGVQYLEQAGLAARIWQQEHDLRGASERLRAGVFARLVSSASANVIKAIEYAAEEAEKAGAAAINLEHLRAGLDRAEKESGKNSG